MKKIALFFLFFSFSMAQNQCEKGFKKVLKIQKMIEEKGENIDQLYSVEKWCDNSEFNIVLADIYFDNEKYNDAIRLYLKKWNSLYAYDIIENLLLSCMQTGKYELAKKIILENNHIDINKIPSLKGLLRQINFAIVQLSDSLDLDIQKLPFCSDYDEYFPSFSSDTIKLVYTMKKKGEDENFYFSTFQNNSWSKPEKMRSPTNTLYNEGAYSISPDGKELFFASCNRLDGYGGCDIYYSELIKDSLWTDPVNLGETVNSKYWESQPSISANKKLLFFSSNREGGLGQRDIWVCKRLGKYNWSEPYNLGDKVNTSKDEITPFIFFDSKTLYFSSKGHVGMGGYDLFVSSVDTDGYFSKTKNMGYPINTFKDESSLIVSKNFSYGYFCSDRSDSDKSDLDLFSFKFPEQFKTKKIIEIAGLVLDSISFKVVTGCNLSIFDFNGKCIGSSVSENDGTFLFNILELDSLLINVNSKDHVFFTKKLFPNKKSNKNYRIILDRNIKGVRVILKNILYEFDDFSLDPSSFFEIERLAMHLRQHHNTKIKIAGHTDNIGSEKYNLNLSKRRAKSVYDKLIEFGVNKKQLSYIGFGFSDPIGDNDSKEGRSLNRRTEIIYD